MARPYSTTGSGLSAFVQYNQQRQSSYAARQNQRAYYSPYYQADASGDTPSIDLRALVTDCGRALAHFWNERGRRMAVAAMLGSARRLRQNLSLRRLFSFPHLLVIVWVVVLLWGERWVFHGKVESCHWSNWENWPAGTNPHRVVLVADPQLIDPHTYPGRPWPLEALTFLITDNYLRRSSKQIQSQLWPDTIFFLGDLFDGGREWKTAHGDFRDPVWGPHPANEQKYLKSWNKKYGEDYWLREYGRFGDIFFQPWVVAGQQPGDGNTDSRRRIITSLPGNHDLGFGSEVKRSVRNRFETYFGDGNRVDVVGNHTFVSVDALSLSAASSNEREHDEVKMIYGPAEDFLSSIKITKRRALAGELLAQRGEQPRHKHRVDDLDKADFKTRLNLNWDDKSPELPTILLSHVPLYRPPGTPCGPMREHWPPTKPPKGESGPVVPDHRNAISVSKGYQYSNVMTIEDSTRLVEKIGNVVHAFSGDDHDYCEIQHSADLANVPEITVKSISMAMGVPTPGFLLLSLHNPIDGEGRPLAGAGQGTTLLTHLCLLPNQLSTFARYAAFACVTLALLVLRAFLVPALGLSPFALDPSEPRDQHAGGGGGGGGGSGNGGYILPVYKAKMDDYDEYAAPAAGFSASRYGGSSSRTTRDRSSSLTVSGKLNGAAAAQDQRGAGGGNSGKKKAHAHHAHGHGHGHGHSHAHNHGNSRWGWGGQGRRQGPRIEIRADDDIYNDGNGVWRAARGQAHASSAIWITLRELWTTVFRVTWMVLLFWIYLNWSG